MNLNGIVRTLKEEQDRVTRQLRGITAALAAFGETYSEARPTRKLSASGRARIAAAQRARWAKARASAAKGERRVVPIRPKRTISAATRRKIATAQKARWAKMKAGRKAA